MPARNRAAVALAAAALLAFYVALALQGSGAPSRNRRLETLSRAAYFTEHVSGSFAARETQLVLERPVSGAVSTATWDLSTYETAHVLGAASACTASVFLLGNALAATSPHAFVDVVLAGSPIGRIAFSRRRTGFYAAASRALVPDVTPQLVDLVPLDRRYGFVFPLARRFCSVKNWTLEVRVRDARWTISHVGLIVSYTPAPPNALALPVWRVAAGFAVAALLVALLVALLLRVATLGSATLAATTAVLAFAPLAWDQWDFPLWIRFSEAASFGGANPAQLWSASPLWAFVPPLFSTLTVASFLTTGDGSRTLTEIALKIGIGLAYCYNAYAIALRAPLRLRRFVGLTALLAPGGLYVLAGGYREPFAGALLLLGLALAERGRLIAATAALWAAASISETLLPMLFFPAALRLVGGGSRARRVGVAVSLATLAAGLFGAEWFALVPHDVAAGALGYRFGSARLGGASWQGALEGLGLLPAWLPVRSPAFGATVFAAGAVLASRGYVANASEQRDSARARFIRVYGTFAALVGAFFLAFRGVDPNTWYVLVVVAAAYFAMRDAASPFPLLLAGVLGLAFYGVVGLGEFVNHELFRPFDRGLLGILGISHYVFDLTLAALTACFFFSAAFDRAEVLTSPNTPWFVALFVSAVATSAIGSDPADVAAYASISLLVVLAVARGVAAQGRPAPEASATRRALGASAVAGTATLWGTRTAAGGVASFAALALATASTAGTCDVVLAGGAAGVLAVQRGFGWASIGGWIALASLALTACVSFALQNPKRILRNVLRRADARRSKR